MNLCNLFFVRTLMNLKHSSARYLNCCCNYNANKWNWSSITRGKCSPGVTLHSNVLSRAENVSIVCAGTLFLLNAASSAIWQQTRGAHTAWDTRGDLHTITKETCHPLATVSESHCQQPTIIHSQCPASGSSFDTVLLGFLGRPVSSSGKPWDRCLVVKRTACYQGDTQIIQTVPQNVRTFF